MNDDIVRVDFEAVTPDFIICEGWQAGWKEGSAGTWHNSIEGRSLPEVLNEYRHNGYAITIFHSKRARALRGEITRIDFTLTLAGWMVSKFPHGWTARTHPIKKEQKGPDFDIREALTWLQQNGWVTVEWEGGARAWKGHMLPIRDREQILKLRRQSEASHNADGHWHYDLAYYF
jgi:hypothetical protein